MTSISSISIQVNKLFYSILVENNIQIHKYVYYSENQTIVEV